jgi:SAM-dependent methyltransferase
MKRHDDPGVVRQEYASEAGLQRRISVYAQSEGENPHDLIVGLVSEWCPCRVLDVGCGPGLIAARLHEIDRCDLLAIDVSERMVELTRARGVNAFAADAQALPFGDEQFDVVVAAWMLYHLPDLDRGLREISRVLRRAGHLIAVTNSVRHLEELWEVVGRDREGEALPFTAENGNELLGRHFAQIEWRDFEGRVTFSDRTAARDYIASYVPTAHLADRLPGFAGPLVATRRNRVFVATKP